MSSSLEEDAVLLKHLTIPAREVNNKSSRNNPRSRTIAYYSTVDSFLFY